MFNLHTVQNLCPFVEETSEKEEEQEFFHLTPPYSNIEAMNFSLWDDTTTKIVNLYPTDHIKKQFDDRPSDESEKIFNEKINNLFKTSMLRISQDTTIYLTKGDRANKILTINDNNLFRNSEKLLPQKYMFVLNIKNELLVETKFFRRDGGRIHHSSLAKGKPVRTAGVLIVTENEDDTKTITIKNESGHYKPSNKSLDRIVTWFKENGLLFEIKNDGIQLNEWGTARVIEIKTLKTQQ